MDEVIIKRVQDKYESVLAIAQARWRYDQHPKVEITDTLKTTAGRAFGGLRKVQLNKALLERETDRMIDQTLPHEIAHLVTDFVFGNVDAHGWQWRSVMMSFGLSPDRTHDMDVSGLAKETRKYNYTCGCVGEVHEVGGKIHNKVLRGSVYICNDCKVRLVNMDGIERQSTYRGLPDTLQNASKAEKCRYLYAVNPGLDSRSMKTLFVRAAGCTTAGAATYFYQLHK